MNYKKIYIAAGALFAAYAFGYVRGHVGARIAHWCDNRAIRKLNAQSQE